LALSSFKRALLNMIAKPDPTKDPEFQKVVRHFLTTPPKPHKALGKKARKREKRAASAKPKTA
jgi:hypothetical protein